MEPYLLRAHQHAKGQVNQRQHDGAEECRKKSSDMEARNNGAGHQKNDGVDDQKEQAQRQNTERKRQQLEKKSQRSIQETHDQRGDHCAAKAGNFKAGNQVSNEQQGHGAQQPEKE